MSHEDPVRDRARLHEILDLDLISEREDPELQALVEEAADELGLPIALVSIVLEDAQYFAAMYGIEGWMKETRGTPVEWSFCANVVRSGAPFLVDDAAVHPKTRSIPLVHEENIRSYAGVPLRTARGQVVGSLCVIGDRARHFDQADVDKLGVFAERVTTALEKRRPRDDAS